MDDSTFRAFMKDRSFLQSILPITDDFNEILQRIFDVNPYRRIGLEELRNMIFHCPRFTTQEASNPTSAPATPPYSPVVEKAMDPISVSAAAAAAVNSYEPVPHLDLSAQAYHSGTPDMMAHPAMFTPPATGPCSPQPTHCAPQPKSVGPSMYPGPFFGNFATFGRCGQMFANFNMPTHAWASTF